MIFWWYVDIFLTSLSLPSAKWRSFRFFTISNMHFGGFWPIIICPWFLALVFCVLGHLLAIICAKQKKADNNLFSCFCLIPLHCQPIFFGYRILWVNTLKAQTNESQKWSLYNYGPIPPMDYDGQNPYFFSFLFLFLILIPWCPRMHGQFKIFTPDLALLTIWQVVVILQLLHD